jgi:hypothetical protein
MNSNQRTYTISNEHLLLIDILNTMYNDNLRQITNLTDSNQQIRNLIIQILTTNTPQRRNNNIYRTNNNSNNNSNNNRTTFRDNNISNGNLGRVYLNNIPYIIDNVEHVRIPINNNSRNINLNNNNDFSRVLQSFFDPVEVYPTQSQIETATRRVRYSDIISPKNTSCPILLTNFNDNDMVTVIRHCGHIFNTNELNTWFRNHCNCPVCRYDIRDDNSNASTAFSSENQNTSNNTSSNTSSQNNRSENTSSNSNVERNNSSTFVSSIFDAFISEYMNERGPELINSLNSIDASGNDEFSEPLRIFRQINNRNNR